MEFGFNAYTNLSLTLERLEDERERQSFLGARPEVKRRLRPRVLGGRPSAALVNCRRLTTATHAAVRGGGLSRRAGVVAGRRRHVSHSGEHAGRVRQDPVSVDARLEVEHGLDVAPVVGRVVLKKRQTHGRQAVNSAEKPDNESPKYIISEIPLYSTLVRLPQIKSNQKEFYCS